MRLEGYVVLLIFIAFILDLPISTYDSMFVRKCIDSQIRDEFFFCDFGGNDHRLRSFTVEV